ncbi:MAG: redoxin domain-containing protein [Desulfuromonadales bacterium]|nr:redoxin domain-containing protein [Desulfuromonadales bacterium]NIR33083.1 redoxin domain-containing protein [Desulfuromonadales bacterium]NIS39321.1 redoxin domain-containing protein [Desulfuromonadales bacterium]
MEGHQRNLYLYDRFNARVAGVSRDESATLRQWSNQLGLTFPLLGNPTGYLGVAFGVQHKGAPTFARRTVVIDMWGRIRYMKKGSPDYREILLLLKKLHGEEDKR